MAAGAGVAAFRPLLRTASPGARLALRAHEVLVGERLVLAAAVVAGGWGGPRALAVLLPLLAVSLVSQRRMRARHEFPPEPAAPPEPVGPPGPPPYPVRPSRPPPYGPRPRASRPARTRRLPQPKG